MTTELNKAIQQAAGAAVELLKKSEQLSLFGGSPEPHHVAYTRTNQSGHVSTVAARGRAPLSADAAAANEATRKANYSGTHQDHIDAFRAHQKAFGNSGDASDPNAHSEAAMHHYAIAGRMKPPRKPRTTINRQVEQPAKFSADTTPAISHSAYDIESTHNSDGDPDRGNVTRAHGQAVANHFGSLGWDKADHAAAEAHHWSQSSVYEHKADNAEMAGNYATADRHRYKMEAHSAIAKMHELARGMTPTTTANREQIHRDIRGDLSSLQFHDADAVRQKLTDISRRMEQAAATMSGKDKQVFTQGSERLDDARRLLFNGRDGAETVVDEVRKMLYDNQ
jgi:hypothetical protein